MDLIEKYLGEKKKSIYIDGKLERTPPVEDKGFLAHLGFITGAPDDSQKTRQLFQDLKTKGKSITWYRGKKVNVEYK